VQLGRKAIEPPGDAREDFWILQELARRMGLPWRYEHPRDVFDEMRRCMRSIAGITWDRLERDSSVTYPCENEGDPGEPVVFVTQFPTATGRGKFVPADIIRAAEQPDDEYPMVLITGRQLEHWHTGSMTRRSFALDSIQPEAHVYLNPGDAADMGIAEGDFVRVSSRRGSIDLRARLSHRDTPGTCFIPFHFREAAANLLTIDEIDPVGKIPEFKFCAVRVERSGGSNGGRPPEHESATASEGA
jgi:formate dehydrogenase major subunit